MALYFQDRPEPERRGTPEGKLSADGFSHNYGGTYRVILIRLRMTSSFFFFPCAINCGLPKEPRQQFLRRCFRRTMPCETTSWTLWSHWSRQERGRGGGDDSRITYLRNDYIRSVSHRRKIAGSSYCQNCGRCRSRRLGAAPGLGSDKSRGTAGGAIC